MSTGSKRITTALICAFAAVFIWTLLRPPGCRADDDDVATRTAANAASVSRIGSEVVVTLSARAEKTIALATRRLASVSRPREMIGYGMVIDPLALARLNGKLETARAELAASREQVNRSRRLYRKHQNVSLRELQAAEAKFGSDRANVESLRAELADRWGARIAAMSPTARSDLIDALVRRRAALVRINVPPRAVQDDASARPVRGAIAVIGDGADRIAARYVDPAPTVNPKLQGRAFLLEVDTQRVSLAPGQAVTGYLDLSHGREHGVIVPRSAIVRFDNASWVYVATGNRRFSRRRVRLTHPTADGWFVRSPSSSLAPGDAVVVTGAEALLSEELSSEIQVHD